MKSLKYGESIVFVFLIVPSTPLLICLRMICIFFFCLYLSVFYHFIYWTVLHLIFLQQLKIPSQPKELTEFETAKRDFFAFLSDEFFKNYLKPSSDLPLSEILIYNQVDVLRSSFDGTPRAALHKAMCEPSCYLRVSSSLLQSTLDNSNTFGL